jgi:hypothetical protein
VNSLEHKCFREGPPGGLRPEFVHSECTNIGLPLGSERALSGNEDRQHFGCATWLHKAARCPRSSLSGKSEKGTDPSEDGNVGDFYHTACSGA